MKVKLFQLYDRKAEATVGPIMVFPKEGPAIREFHGILALKDSQPNRYPEDYDLLYLGDQETDHGGLNHNDYKCPHCGGAMIVGMSPLVIATGAGWKSQRDNSADRTAITLDALNRPGTLTAPRDPQPTLNP